LVELMIAVAVCSFGFAGLSALSMHCRRLVAAQRETVAAGQLIQERLEQVRSAGWNRLTSANTLRDQVLGTPCSHADLLGGAREWITVTPYPAPSPAPVPLRVERTAGGTAQIVSDPGNGFSLRRLTAVRVDIKVQWNSRQAQRTRNREISTIVAVGGVLK
jgi:type II secretory pathway pseudopilin PulG